MESNTRTAFKLGAQLAIAERRGDSDRMAAIKRQFLALQPPFAERGTAEGEELARLLEAYHDGYNPRRRG